LLLIGVFIILAIVPLLLASVLFGWASLGMWSSGAALTLELFGLLFLLAFYGSGTYVHALLIATGNRAKDGTFSLLSVFAATRKLYWRVVFHDFLMLLLFLPAFILFTVFLYTAQSWAWILATLWMLAQTAFFAPAPFLLEKKTVWKSLVHAAGLVRKPRPFFLRLLGVLAWALVPMAAWLVMVWPGAVLTALSQALINISGLALAAQWYFPIYIASPADVVPKLFLLVINAAYLVVVNVWLARQK
jgi:hypothetical protein